MEERYTDIYQKLSSIEIYLARLSKGKSSAPEGYLTKKELKNRIKGLHDATIYRYMREGILKGYKFGKQTVFKASEIDESIKPI